MYDKARMLEKDEQQYMASANVRNMTKSVATQMDHRSDRSKSGQHGKDTKRATTHRATTNHFRMHFQKKVMAIPVILTLQ